MPADNLASNSKIAVIGTHHLSHMITRGLLRNGHTQITIITSTSQDLLLPRDIDRERLNHKRTDFSPPSLEQALNGHDLVISTVSPGDFDLQKRIIDACIAVHVQSFIPNEFGFDSQNEQIQRLLPAYKTRSLTIEYLRTVQSQIEWVAIATGVILDHAILNGKLGFDVKWQSGSIPGSKDAQFTITSSLQLGEVVARVVDNWSQFRNSYLYISDSMVTAGQVVEALQDEMKADWTVDDTEVKDARRSAEQMLRSGWPDSGWALIERSIIFGGEGECWNKFTMESCVDRLGLRRIGPRKIIHGALHEWNHSRKNAGDCGCN